MMANNCSAMFACSCLRKSPIRLMTNRSFMLTQRTFMSSGKCGVRDSAKVCCTKFYHGVAHGGPTRSFSGQLLEANRSIVGAVLLSQQIFLSCDTERKNLTAKR